MRLKVIFLSFVLLAMAGCNRKKSHRSATEDYIPADVDFILKINNITAYLGELRNNAFLADFTGTNTLETLEALESTLHTENSFYYCTSKQGTTIVYPATTFSILKPELKNKFEQLENEQSLEISLAKQKWELFKTETTITLSTTENNTTNLTDKQPLFMPLLKITGNTVTASVLFQNKEHNNINKLFSNFKQLTNTWASFDIITKPKELILSGLANKPKTSLYKLLSNAESTTPETAKITPNTDDGFLSYTFGNLNKLPFIIKPDSVYLTSSISEIGFTKKDSLITSAVVFTPFYENIMDFCASAKEETYRDIAIYKIDPICHISKLFKQFQQVFIPKFVMNYDNYVLFSNNLDNLHEQLNQILNNHSFINHSTYRAAYNALPENATALQVTRLIDSNKKEQLAILQANPGDNGNLYLNFILKEEDTPQTTEAAPVALTIGENAITEIGSIQIEAPLAVAPQLLDDYITKSLNVVVQDTKNQLYLISLHGKVLWKKQLDGKIQGKISQIDLNNNGRLQLAFTTQKSFYVVTRQGKDVSNFPVSFKSKMSNPTAIFDYDLKKDYRFLISQENRLYMINENGARVNGFKLNNVIGNITATPKHIRVGSKDYIVFKTDANKWYIVNRRGGIRVPVQEKFNFSHNDIFWYNNAFTTTNSKGNLIEVTESGAIKNKTLPLAEKHYIDISGKDFISFSENILAVNDTLVTLDFGDYTPPKIHNVTKGNLIATTDKQTNKLYVYNTNGKLLPGFPIYGKGIVDIAYDKKTGKNHVVVQGNTNEFIIYQLN